MTEPWVRFEDDHLLVTSKAAGINTHKADEHAPDGMYEWVQRQRPGVALSILHRLDRGTSGLLLFGRSAAANRSLAQQFDDRTITKRYELLTTGDAGAPVHHSEEPVRARGRGAAQAASTDFERIGRRGALVRFAAHPHTGRTHQVRVHAAGLGIPVVGDTEYGGTEAPRLFLHAAGLRFEHPTEGELDLVDPPPASFDRAQKGESLRGPALAAAVAHEARAALFDPADTDAYLWIDRQHDGFPGIRVERLGDAALVLDYREVDAPVPDGWLDAWGDTLDLHSLYVLRRPRRGGGEPAHVVRGADRPQFTVTELGRRYLIDLAASTTSSGLFLDQRETRRRLLTSDLSGRTVLNTFAHTGALSVAAATAGAETLTLDLSPRYLDWARENLRANDLDPADHDFVYGDALEWLGRLAKKGRTFDVVLLDPPSSSTPKKGGKRWVAERDLHVLVERGARLVAPGGTLFVSTNLHRMRWPAFLEHLERGLGDAGRTASIETQTLPLDHRSGPGDPPYLKAAWIRLDGAADR